MKTDAEIETRTPEARRGNADAAARAAGQSLAALAEELAWRLPGCSDLEMRKALQRSARSFCERTYCWQEEAGPPAGPNGMGAWEFAAPAGAVVLNVRENRSWLYGSTLARPAFRAPGGDWFGAGAPPPPPIRSGWAGIPGPHPLFMLPPSRAHAPFLTRGAPPPVFALAPEIGGETLPPELIGRWGAAIVSGAAAELCMMAGRPWSDPNVAALEARQFDAAVGEASLASIASIRRSGPGPCLTCRGRTPFVV